MKCPNCNEKLKIFLAAICDVLEKIEISAFTKCEKCNYISKDEDDLYEDQITKILQEYIDTL